MSKLKKLAVCLTALIIVFSFSVLTVSAGEISADNVVIGELPVNYEHIDFDVVQASWYRDGSYIGDSAVEIVSTGGYRFKDTLYDYINGELVELRIYIQMPNEYIDKYYNYFFQINSFESRLVPYESTASLVKYNYQSDNQTNYILDWYNIGNIDRGFQVENTSIYLTKDIIVLSLFYNAYGNSSYPNVQEAFKPIEVLIGGAQYSRNDPSSPGYVAPDDSSASELEEIEGELIGSTNDVAQDEIKQLDGLWASLYRYYSSFAAISSLFEDFLLLKVPDFSLIVMFSLAIGIIPLIVGMTVNGLRERDRAAARERYRSFRNRGG